MVRHNQAQSPQAFWIAFKFGTPHATWNLRSEKLFKKVKTEKQTYSIWSLVGNVGGTLGMFIGFSILGTTEWLGEIIRQFFSRHWK